jgi:hypothetical protein
MYGIVMVILVILVVCVTTTFRAILSRVEQDMVEWTQFTLAYTYANDDDKIRLLTALRSRSFVDRMLRRAPRRHL